MKNKCGDVPVTILVIGVFAICALAIISFMVSNYLNLEKDSWGLEVIEKVNADVEKFEFYRGVLGNNDESADRINAGVDGGGYLIIENRGNSDTLLIEKYKYQIKS